MLTHGEMRIEPSAEILDATRQWLEKIQGALGNEFLAAYLTGSVLTQGFDAQRSKVNVLVVARELRLEELDALRQSLPETRKPPHFDPLFLSRAQIEKSLDVFPIEWLEIQERHMRIEGADVFETLEVPRTYLRLQCEHELRRNHIQLRHAYLGSAANPGNLARVLESTASSFATLFRTLLRLHGEAPPGDAGRVVERVADLYQVDAQGLLVAHLVRYSGRRYPAEEITPLFRKFLAEVDRLAIAIDQLRVT
jgi:hypothetical protein